MSAINIHIILIEDNPADARLISEYLKEPDGNHIRFEHVTTLQAGLAYLDKTSPDLILLDMNLPDSSGLDTFDRTRAIAPHIPIIILTHTDNEDLALQIVHRGAQDYLVKGEVNSHLLIRAIRYAIERKKLGEKLAGYAEKLYAKNAQLTDDLNMAREVQQALLPQTYPKIPARKNATAIGSLSFAHRYKPSAAVGGDFFNVNAVSNTVASVFFCDVMGHGMRSALVTAIIRGLLERLRTQSEQPGKFMAELNNSLSGIFRQTDHLIFASALLIMIDVETGVMRYSVAGHPGPLQVNRQTGCVNYVNPLTGQSNPALGLFNNAVYKETEKRLHLNDIVILSTDGLYEATDDKDNEFGQDRLVKSIRKRINAPPRQILDGMINDVETFTGKKSFADDICLLSIALD